MSVVLARRGALRALAGCAAVVAAPGAWALRAVAEPQVQLSQAQSRAFQAWMLRIVNAQIERGPSPRLSMPSRICSDSTVTNSCARLRRLRGRRGTSLWFSMVNIFLNIKRIGGFDPESSRPECCTISPPYARIIAQGGCTITC